MRTGLAALALVIAAPTLIVPPVSAQSPTFEVVSIKRNAANVAGRFENPTQIQRPDGGFTMTFVPIMTLIARAYPPHIPIDMVGLPDWARLEYYDVSATSTLAKATPDDRIAMLRAMLADRFKLTVHVEKREQQVYDLVLARNDGRLGPGLKPSNVDCAAQLEAQRAAAEAAQNGGPPLPRPQTPDFKAPPPPCTLRTIGAVLRDRMGDGQGRQGDLLEAETTIGSLVNMLRMTTGRPVVDKTGLTGTYYMRMNFDQNSSRGGPEVVPSPDAPPSVFTAIREQLGLKLDSSHEQRDTLIVDRLERPTEN
ncbi:MAG TPA: TIGR03435 family protein [Vicinamibacterales bacterium]|nr:TIGR03435 family protein [Vicinamibacterales bacterium]